MAYLPSRESSVTVAIRVRPFTENESQHLIKTKDDQIFLGDGALSLNTNNDKENLSTPKRYSPRGIRKIVDVVDDRMLIFDPPENNPLASLSKNIFTSGGQKRTTRFREHRFVFDKLFDDDASQEDVYEKTTRPLLDTVLDGYNATVFAYGATGCGKTHTISGTLDQPGIIFLTMRELFERIDELRDTKHIDVSLSYLEIYNETIRDLIVPDNGGKILTLREDANKRISVSNLSTHEPKCVEDVMDMIVAGNQNRTSSPTAANATSSRSHAVLQINITQRARTADVTESHTFATLSIIDLAGSERAAATRNRGQRLHEGANINRSLLALGNCINALCDLRRKNHVPYRDSKLTRLLKFSLGGNCKTVMIVCISPSSLHYDETLNTLKYANRAKEIKTKLMRNQHNLDRHVGSYLKMITEQKQEIQELRSREKIVIDQAINRYKIKRERVSIGILEFIDTLKQNLNSNKYQNVKLKKSLILCKRQLLLSQKVELEKVNGKLQSMDQNAEYLKDSPKTINDLIFKMTQKIKELEASYEQETEIDLMLSGSANNGIRKLMELEAWSDYDKLNLDMSLMLIKDSVDKTILQNSSILVDKLIKNGDFVSNFKLLDLNYFKVIAKLSDLMVSDQDIGLIKSEVQQILENFSLEIDLYMEQILNIDNKFEKFANEMQNSNINLEIKIPTSPIRKLARSKTSSPFKMNSVSSTRLSLTKPLTITKVTKSSSPYRDFALRPKPIKKVRWDVPHEPFDSSFNDQQDQSDSDVDMDDSPQNTRKVEIDTTKTYNDSSGNESILDQSFQELENVITSSKKRKSLTSKPLKPSLITHKKQPSSPTTASLPIPTSVNQVSSGGLGAPIRINDDSMNSN